LKRVEALRHTITRIDGRGYKAYKEIEGSWSFPKLSLYIDHVQADPFAPPSKVRLRLSHSETKLPEELFADPTRRLALEDVLARNVYAAIQQNIKGHRDTGKSDLIKIDVGGQEVLNRTALVVTSEWVEARLFIGLPAAGRRVLGRQAEAILCEALPRIVERGLVWTNLPQEEISAFVACVENQEHIRKQLDMLGLIAFVADGAVLPRESGASDKPLNPREAVPFKSPDPLRISVSLPNLVKRVNETTNVVSGMGIPKGVTLIVGGGYHGKSTLLRALERGVYPHIPGDGREYVVANPHAVKIRAEDGRRVDKVNMSAFISDLPYGNPTRDFSSEDASGSTSQAANIVEALETGAQVLLLDEDTSASNFMVRDARMQALVDKENEPITPFLDRVHEIHERLGVSTVLVMGGCGDYFDVADTVIMMRNYLPYDVSAEAQEVTRAYPTARHAEALLPLSRITERIPLAESFDPSRGRRAVKIVAKGIDRVLYGREPIDLRYLEQLVDWSQTRAIGAAIHLARRRFIDGKRTLREILDALEAYLDQHGLDHLDPFYQDERHPGAFARPRRYEIAGAINRLRTLTVRQRTNED
jgi:predicted ABC-class ATPase